MDSRSLRTHGRSHQGATYNHLTIYTITAQWRQITASSDTEYPQSTRLGRFASSSYLRHDDDVHPSLIPHPSSPYPSFLSPLTSHLSPLTSPLLPLTYYLLPLTSYLSTLHYFCRLRHTFRKTFRIFVEIIISKGKNNK